MNRILVPPVYFLIALSASLLLHRLVPLVQLISAPWHWLGLLCAVPAGLLAGLGARALARRGTTLNPFGEPTALVTDGPFAETREQLGGYYVIEAGDLDAAIAIAERIPPARFGTIEIRPVMEIGGLPAN